MDNANCLNYFKGQYSLKIQYEIQEKLMTCILLSALCLQFGNKFCNVTFIRFILVCSTINSPILGKVKVKGGYWTNAWPLFLFLAVAVFQQRVQINLMGDSKFWLICQNHY